MTVRTPYDDDRSRYSHQALARLALSAQASGLSDAAGSLVITRYDEFNGPGARVSEAAAIVGHADLLLTRTVIFERERGTSWDDIGRYLGLDGPQAQQRFAAAVAQWRAAFDEPYRLDDTGRKRIPQLPSAAYDPASAVRRLDLWAAGRAGYDDHHAVSSGLRPPDDSEPPEGTEIEGRIQRSELGRFLSLVSQYVGHRSEVSTSDAVSGTYPIEGIFESVDVHLRADGELIDVVVAGAHSPELRVRIRTLLDVYS